MNTTKPALRVAACVLWMAAFAVSVSSAQLPEGVTQGPSVEGITEYQLDNGLRVLSFPDPSKETVTVNITYLVGSRHEGYGESGMAHLLEHMVFKGTPDHPDIPQELTAHGSRPNGTTWFDRTNYFETFSATEENLDWALDLEADRMVNSFIKKEDLESEFSVVRNEFEMGENYPQGVLIDRMMSAAYVWHNYGKSTIGSRADIERVPIENLKAFYERWYRPDNAVLVVSGNFDEATTLEKVAARFGRIERPSEPVPVTYTVEPAQDGERFVELRRVGDVQVVGALYHVPAGSHEDFAAVDLLAYILGDEPSGRLYKDLVETQKASSVYAWPFQLYEPGVVLFGAEVRKEKSLDDARETMLAALDAFADEPPTQVEVDRARDNRIKNWERTLRNSERAAIELSEWSSMGDWRLMFLHRDRLKAVTPEDVQRVAQSYLRPENRTVGVYIPTESPVRAEIPERPEIEPLVRDYVGGEALAVGEAFDASCDAIEGRLVRSELDPGIQLVMLPKKTRGATVQVVMNFHLGGESSLQGLRTIGGLTGSTLMRGTSKHTRQEIQDAFDRLKAQVRVDGSPTRAFANIETTRENLPEVLGLVAEILREPSFPESEFELVRQEQLTQLEDSKTDPFQIAMTTLQRHMNPWPESDPRYVPTPEEAIAAVQETTVEEIQRFHEEFYGASAAEIAIVGDFDAEPTGKLFGELFEGWASRAPYERLADPYRERPVVSKTVETPDKESAVFLAGLGMPLRDDDPDYPAMVLGNFMTGGGFLNSRLATRIRQQEGISYGVGSFFSASAFDKDASFGSYAIYAPQNADLLVRAYKEELLKVLESGFTEDEISQAKQGWVQRRKVSRSTDRELARTLASRAYEGRSLNYDAGVESAVAELTNDAIVSTMRKYIDIDEISMVQAGDFVKVRKESEGAAGAEPETVP